MVDIYEVSMLIDFYGQLLTGSQLRCLEMHYNQDLSLAEIADELGISRQGVHDFIKRGRTALFDYEEKLKLLARFQDVRAKLEEIQEELPFLDNPEMSENDRQLLRSMEERIFSIITKL